MYKTSKDYGRLYELANKGEKIPCWVDYQSGTWDGVRNPATKAIRDIAEVRCYHGQVNVQARGICYTDGITKEAFIKQCEQLNVEFIEPGARVLTNKWTSVNDHLPEAGTSVLVCTQAGTILRAFHMPKFHTPAAEFYSEDDIGDYCEEKDEYFAQEGWYEKNGFEPVNRKVDESVTHWTPLPAGPNLTLKKENESEASNAMRG